MITINDNTLMCFYTISVIFGVGFGYLAGYIKYYIYNDKNITRDKEDMKIKIDKEDTKILNESLKDKDTLTNILKKI